MNTAAAAPKITAARGAGVLGVGVDDVDMVGSGVSLVLAAGIIFSVGSVFGSAVGSVFICSASGIIFSLVHHKYGKY